ncbi:MAG: 30S ribosomal protein S5 [Planctomycetota bacterium]|nr:30S ribosomal protein S5 [Planctomycetota bacterium]
MRRERELEEIMVSVYRCSATVKGGRRLSFAALVVVGDGQGKVGLGYGKAKEVPGAYQKAVKSGRKNMLSYPIVGDGTIPHAVTGRYGAATVRLIPARPGTGLIAGTAVKALLEVCGYKNILTKSFGSNNAKNLLKATLDALGQLRSKEQIAALRGVTL